MAGTSAARLFTPQLTVVFEAKVILWEFVGTAFIPSEERNLSEMMCDRGVEVDFSNHKSATLPFFILGFVN